ncbi:restriction endonuclease subunit S [Streptomyces yangpuensis]|uniref:restriction endonuclease subunit S n=1 Tax=Streptomyces yangpuensis TaxID=1648182 RepID=UPI00365C157D
MRGEVGTNTWPTVRLEMVATVTAGVTLGSGPSGDGTIELPYLRVANVLDGSIDTTEVKTIRILRSQIERYALQAGDLLLTEGGDLDKLGRGAVWDGALDPCLHQNHVFRVRCGEELSSEFLALYTSSPAGRAYFQSVGKQTTNLASINSTQVKHMLIPVPPRAEQERLLGPVRELRDRVSVLERLRAKGAALEAALSAHALAEADDWSTRPLESVATVAAGVTLGSEPVGDGVVELPYLRVANVLDGRIDTTEVKTVRILRSQYERYALRAGDLLLTEGGDLDKLGRGAVWDGRLDPCLHQNHVFRVRCGDELSPDFLALYTSSPAGRAYFQSVGKQTTNLASINSTQVKAMPVPVPPLAEQERLLGPVRAIRARNEALGRQIEKLRVVQLGLVDDLLSGRVRVSQG